MKTCVYFLIFLFVIAITFFANTAYSQNYSTVSKKCGSCQGSVSFSSKIGDYCPHCGVRWGYENTTKRETQSSSTVPYNNSRNTYMVIQSKAYFHTNPSASSRKNSYIVYGEIITAKVENNGYIYTSFINNVGQRTTGWVLKASLIEN